MRTNIPVAIIEDTQTNQEIIARFLEIFFEGRLSICGYATDVDEGLDLIQQTGPALIFLDIQLRAGTGFDILDRCIEQGIFLPEIIFITAYGKYEYATRAFEYSAIDFLTKPVDPDKFERAVSRALERIQNKGNNDDQIRHLLDVIRNGANKRTQMAFHRVKGIIEFIEVQRILYCEADGSLTRIHLADGNVISAMRHLGHYTGILVRDFPFHPISNKCVVNMDYVKSYDHGELVLALTNGEVLYASRRGGTEFRRKLQGT